MRPEICLLTPGHQNLEIILPWMLNIWRLEYLVQINAQLVKNQAIFHRLSFEGTPCSAIQGEGGEEGKGSPPLHPPHLFPLPGETVSQ